MGSANDIVSLVINQTPDWKHRSIRGFVRSARLTLSLCLLGRLFPWVFAENIRLGRVRHREQDDALYDQTGVLFAEGGGFDEAVCKIIMKIEPSPSHKRIPMSDSRGTEANVRPRVWSDTSSFPPQLL